MGSDSEDQRIEDMAAEVLGDLDLMRPYITQFWVVRMADKTHVVKGPYNDWGEAHTESRDDYRLTIVETRHRIYEVGE
jgi:hypothetical protein